MRLLGGHTKAVRSVAYLPDGRLVSGGDDARVRVWDAAGECERVFKADGKVYAVAVHPAGSEIVSAGRGSPGSVTVDVWELDGSADGDLWQPLTERGRGGRTPAVRSLAVTGDGRFAAAACRLFGGGGWSSADGAYWWRVETGTADAFPGGPAYAVAAAPGGSVVAVTSSHAVELFDAPDRPPRARYEDRGVAEWWPAVAFLGCGLLAVAAGSWLLFVDPGVAEKARRVRTGVRILAALAVHPDGKSVLVGGSPGGIERVDAATGERLAAYDFGVGKVHGLAFAPDGHTFAVAGQGGLAVCDWE